MSPENYLRLAILASVYLLQKQENEMGEKTGYPFLSAMADGTKVEREEIAAFYWLVDNEYIDYDRETEVVKVSLDSLIFLFTMIYESDSYRICNLVEKAKRKG